jgi:hypothetical protein
MLSKEDAAVVGKDLHRLVARNMLSGVPMTAEAIMERTYAADEQARSRTGRMSIKRDNVWYGMDYGAAERSWVYSRFMQGDWSSASPVSAYVEPTGPVDAPSRLVLTRVAVATEEELTLDEPRRALAVEAEDLLGYAPLAREVKAPGRLRRALAKLEIEVLDEASVDAYKTQMVQHYWSHKKMSDPTWRLTKLREYKQPVPEYVLAKAVSIKRELPEAEFYIDQLAVDPFLIVSLGPVKDSWTNCKRAFDPETQAYVEVWDEPKFEGTL